MKKLMLLLAVITNCCYSAINAQNNSAKATIAVLNLDTKTFGLEPSLAGSMARLELDKLDQFEVMDRYDIEYMLSKEDQNIANCYGKLCLTDIAKKIKAEKMLGGTIELISDRIVITLKLIDVATVSVEKTQVMDFLNVKNQLPIMIGITLRKMLKLPTDEAVVTQLTKSNSFDTAINTPDEERVNLNGPRMGAAFFSGETAKVFKAAQNVGGYDLSPTMFQFGYQLEMQYIGQGNFQALVEFLPMITGLDQGKAIPSFTVLNGLRDNRLGLEFAFGPSFLVSKRAEGYYDGEQNWHLTDEWDSTKGANPHNIVKRMDSRGSYTITSGFIFAFGKTFRSGRLNIPVNAYIRPNSKNGSQYGISVGFNARSIKKKS